MEEYKKSRRLCSEKVGGGGGGINNLSDDLICYILSFLLTREACKTCVLSKRWKTLYTMVPNLHFNLQSHHKETSLVNKIMGRRIHNIKKFKLHNSKNNRTCYQSNFDLWISKALDLNVAELNLKLGEGFVIRKFLPNKIFKSKSLEVLRLRNYFELRPSLSSYGPYLPSLKILDINNLHVQVSIKYYETIYDVIYGCPHLEELRLEGYIDQHFTISLPFLKRLYLDYNDPDPFGNCRTRLNNFIKEKENHEILQLFPFHNLHYLWIGMSKYYNMDLIVSLLHKAPRLEVLVIKKNYKRKEFENKEWIGPPVTPTCLSTSLKTLEFRGIQKIEAELDFIQYIMESSSKLEKIKIYIQKSKNLKKPKSKLFLLIERILLKGKKKSLRLLWEIIETENCLDTCKDS